VRLPRVVGLGRALDLVLTGRAVDAREALSMGLVNRVVPAGSARAEAEALAAQLAALPQACLRLDRASVLEQQGLSELEALRSEFARLAAQPQLLDDASKGARLFASGQGRGGAPVARAGGALLGEGRLAAAPVSSSAAAVTRVHPPLRAVLFDVGGVLTDSPVLVIEEYAAARGLPSGKLNRMFAASEHWAQLETGTISLAEFTARFQAELDGLGLERVRVAELLAFFEHLPLRPAFVEAVRDAARRGLIVAAVTNNWRLEPHEQGQRNMRQAVHELFEGRVFESSVEGRRKPSPDFFHLVCRRLEVQPDECLLVDDIPANLASAAKLGMRTVRVPLRQAERALPELLAHFGSGHEDAVAALERESPRARL
jgi:epoxide hydrolase-like predicted phosphatase